MTDLITTNSNSVSLFDAQKMNDLERFAQKMASAKISVPTHLADNPGDCLAIAMQAAQWGMNPFAVAQKTHLVSGKLGYEAQLVNAVISSSKAIVGRFKYEMIGDWSSWKPSKKNCEEGLGVRVGAQLAGEQNITWGHVIFLETVAIRNSPLWKTNPYQQICYLAVKMWSRIYTPDVILGVYTPDELQQTERVINPVSLNDIDFDEPAIEQEPAVDAVTYADAELSMISCSDIESLAECFQYYADTFKADKNPDLEKLIELKDRLKAGLSDGN